VQASRPASGAGLLSPIAIAPVNLFDQVATRVHVSDERNTHDLAVRATALDALRRRGVVEKMGAGRTAEETRRMNLASLYANRSIIARFKRFMS
jgi:hypothetical protein